MTLRQRKAVQWADEEDVENQKTSKTSGSLKKTMTVTSNSSSVTKKLVQVKSYSGYAENLAVEKCVRSSISTRKSQKFDRNLSTVREEEDDGENE